eukprot:1797260-Pyramimonas_sp.AAC.1
MEPVARSAPSGEKATDQTGLVWPVRVRCRLPSAVLHSFVVKSLEPVASSAPSGEKATEYTAPVWPVRVCCRLQGAVVGA